MSPLLTVFELRIRIQGLIKKKIKNKLFFLWKHLLETIKEFRNILDVYNRKKCERF